MTIWKYVLHEPVQDLMIPAVYRPLAVGSQDGQLVMWVMVDPDQRPTKRRFRTYGTGHLGVEGQYVGTTQIHGLVWHVFEQVNVGLGE